MDTLKTYQEIIKQVISDYAKLRPSHGDIHLDLVFDDYHNRYALMQVGWDRERRVRGNLIYVNIENNKVVIEYDGLENGITQDLIERGISKDDIILAFLPDSQKNQFNLIRHRFSLIVRLKPLQDKDLTENTKLKKFFPG